MMTIMLVKCAFWKCHVNLKKILNSFLSNKLQKWQSILRNKKSLSFIIWMKVKSSPSKKSIQEIKWEKLMQIRKRMMILLLNNNIKNYYKWKNKLINRFVKLKAQHQKSTKGLETEYWPLIRLYMIKRDKNSKKIVTKLRMKSIKMTSMIT